MTKSTSPQDVGGHVSIKPEGMGPRDSLFTFQAQKKRFGGAVGISIATHTVIALLLVAVARYVSPEVFEAVLPDQLSNRIVFLPSPGPGGGGGGGNKMPDPPKPAEIPKAKPPEPIPVTPVDPTPEPPKEPEEVAPVQTLAAVEPNPGALTNNTSNRDRKSVV